MIKSTLPRTTSVAGVAALALAMSAGTANAQQDPGPGLIPEGSIESIIEHPVETAQMSLMLSVAVPAMSVNCVVNPAACPP